MFNCLDIRAIREIRGQKSGIAKAPIPLYRAVAAVADEKNASRVTWAAVNGKVEKRR
jgi:hypothetical protein